MGLFSSSESNSESNSSETPFAPEYINKSGDQVGELINSAKSSASDQKARLSDYINHLYQLREFAKMAAKGSASRGANGMQNPMSVFQSVNEMANQAGIPIDAEIGKALQSGNSIENTLNGFLDSASKVYATLGSIPNRKSNSESFSHSNGGGEGGGGARIGGGNRGGGGNGGQGTFTDIYGNVRSSANGPMLKRNEDPYNPQNYVAKGFSGQTPNGNAGGDAGNDWNMMSGAPSGDSYTGGFNWSGLPGLQSFGVDPSHEAFSMMDGVNGGSYEDSGNFSMLNGVGGSSFGGPDDSSNNYSPSSNFDFFNNYTPTSSYSPSWQGNTDAASYPDDFAGAYQPAYEDYE